MTMFDGTTGGGTFRQRLKSPLKHLVVAWVWAITLGVVSGGVAGAQASDPDLNNDGVVNILDVSFIGSNFTP